MKLRNVFVRKIEKIIKIFYKTFKMKMLKKENIRVEISKEEQISRDLTKKYGEKLLKLIEPHSKLPINEFDRIGIEFNEIPLVTKELCRAGLLKQDERNGNYFEITLLGSDAIQNFDAFYSDYINKIDNQRKEELYDKRITRKEIEEAIKSYKTTKIISIIALIVSFIALFKEFLISLMCQLLNIPMQ